MRNDSAPPLPSVRQVATSLRRFEQTVLRLLSASVVTHTHTHAHSRIRHRERIANCYNLMRFFTVTVRRKITRGKIARWNDTGWGLNFSAGRPERISVASRFGFFSNLRYHSKKTDPFVENSKLPPGEFLSRFSPRGAEGKIQT